MASPVDAGRLGTIGTAVSSHVCNLPGSISAGDLLIVAHWVNNSSITGTYPPTGYTSIYNRAFNGDADPISASFSVFYKVAAGGETTATVACVTATKWASCAWRITGHDSGTPPVADTAITHATASSSPNPTSFSPAGGSKDYLWIWVGAWNKLATAPPTGTPTNYSNAVGASSSGNPSTSNAGCAGATRQNTAASEDPPVWTTSAAVDWAAITIAVYPVAGGAAPGRAVPRRRADRFLTFR